MNKISTHRPETFIEAVQLLFSFHCCLHLSGEPTSIGRLDQLLEPFLQGTPAGEVQEIIDCLFVKLCEHVHLNTRLLNDMGTWGMTAVPYASTGMFPNGDTINQWVQQVRTLRVRQYSRALTISYSLNNAHSAWSLGNGVPYCITGMFPHGDNINQ